MTCWISSFCGSLALVLAYLAAAPAAVTFTGVQPQLASSGHDTYLAFGLGNSISVARSDDGGQTFGRPSRVPISGKLSLGMHRGPHVAATGSVVLVTAIAGAKGGGADGDVLLVRSRDRGASWGEPVVINDVPGSAREGLHTMAATSSGLVVVTWLDLRAGGTRIVAAVSRDHGATWAADTLVYAAPAGGVCECCHPSVALDTNGDVAIMFRNNLDGNRDMYIVRSAGRGRFSAATRMDGTSWVLNACPMDGGGLTLIGGAISAAWRRADGIFLRENLGPERRIGTGRDPAIARSGDHHDVVWSASDVITLARDSARPVVVAPGRFPSLVAFPDRTLVAWEDQGTIIVRAIPR